MEIQPMLAALAEPTRFRIVELLSTRACTVGEVAEGVGALQPQTTKHIQALEAAGLIRVHKLGRRRVARLDRETMSALSSFFRGLAHPTDDDDVLGRYETAITREEEHLGRDAADRVLTFEQRVAAPVADVWEAWTDPRRAAGWWAPRHFDVDLFEIVPEPDTPIRIVLREGDGTTYESAGRVEEAVPGARLVFTLAPVDSGGAPLFEARHTLTLSGVEDSTALSLGIAVSEVRREAAAAVAGLEPGWTQLLDALRQSVEG